MPQHGQSIPQSPRDVGPDGGGSGGCPREESGPFRRGRADTAPGVAAGWPGPARPPTQPPEVGGGVRPGPGTAREVKGGPAPAARPPAGNNGPSWPHKVPRPRSGRGGSGGGSHERATLRAEAALPPHRTSGPGRRDVTGGG